MKQFEDLTKVRIMVIAHTIAAIIVAYISPLMERTLYAGGVGIVVLLALGYPLARVLGNKGIKWWFINGVMIYFLVWLVGWIYFINW